MENKTINKKERKIFTKANIPNMLLILRMVLAVVIIVLIMMDCYGFVSKTIYTLKDPFKKVNGEYTKYCDIDLVMLIAGIFFVIASATDWLDGFLARKYNWVSEFGKFWDPIADKVLVNSVLIGFAWADLIPTPFVIIMIVRDIIVDAKRMTAARKNIVVAANIYGKMKTVLQMVSLVFIFFIFQGHDFAQHPITYFAIQNLLIYCATIVSVLSGVIYFININKEIKNKQLKAIEEQQKESQKQDVKPN